MVIKLLIHRICNNIEIPITKRKYHLSLKNNLEYYCLINETIIFTKIIRRNSWSGQVGFLKN